MADRSLRPSARASCNRASADERMDQERSTSWLRRSVRYAVYIGVMSGPDSMAWYRPDRTRPGDKLIATHYIPMPVPAHRLLALAHDGEIARRQCSKLVHLPQGFPLELDRKISAKTLARLQTWPKP